MPYRTIYRLTLIAGIVTFSFAAPQTGGTTTPDFQPDFGACSAPVTPAEERELLSDQRRYERLSVTLQSKGKSAESELRQTQAKLLRILERQECKRLATISDTVIRGPAGTKPRFVELPVGYATDRLIDPQQGTAARRDFNRLFSGVLDPDFKDFSYGTVKVTIPTQRRPGELNLPSSWQFVSQPDPERFFVLRDISVTNRDRFFEQINALDTGGENSLLLFVHGFNVTFADAAMRTAQLAHDLKFNGKVMTYSWPSVGNVESYWQDEDSSRISSPRFRKLLAELLKTKVTRIYIVAHSMGTRIVIPAVSTLAAEGTDVSKISELLLAAADFNVVEFKDLASTFQSLRAKGTHVTIYAASNDFALQASRRVHSYGRLGESTPKLNVFPSLDSVDATAAAPMKRAYGHSYVCDSAQVIGDMQDLILKGLKPAERGLLLLPGTLQLGWKIPALPQ
jgi:esterase/lipase superfamily enzyme